ncbi:MAG TPA: carboxypeptidase-like regulatory domain-containing protein [Acidobacteriaceae bacterium]|nr:carboxypeptidase-like regulatory domain-containing protein [Acidobacteriaceae bacterium]
MKPKHLRLTLLFTLPIFAFGAAIAQTATPPPTPRIQVAPQPTTPQIGGTVTGHVYCGDTQRPARFADVELLQQGSNTSRGVSYQTAGRGRTALDGSFTITGVTAGDYYVSATMSGYISQQAVARMTQQPIARVPMTHIDAGRTADVVVTMDRGAVVSGRVTYDDGSAVPGVSVRLRPLTTSTTGSMGNGGGQFGGGFGGFIAYGGDMGFGETDDRGIYRLTGIAPGKYSLVVTVQTETTGQGRASGRGGFRGPPPMLNVYAPGTMRKADAQIVEIHGGETADGVDIRVALNGLHTVQGSVESKADGHMLNSGSVSLTDATDSSTTRSTVIDADGTFRMEYLPPGTYNVTVSGMDRPPNTGRGGNRGPTIRYTAASQTVTLGDSDLTMDPVQATVAASSTSTSQ